jgi:hypothetical protein
MARTIFILAILAQEGMAARPCLSKRQPQPISPVDPCRQYSVDYSTAGAAGNASGLLAAISAMSTPIRSFRPLAAF